MPLNKNAMTRYRILDELLSNRYHNYSIDDLVNGVNEQLAILYPGKSGVGRRTIEKDIYYLEYEGPYLVDIERYYVPSINPKTQKTYSKKCLRYTDSSFSIFKKELSDDEMYVLGEALSVLGQFDGLPNFEELERLRQSLKLKRNDSSIISFSRNALESTNLFGELFTYISNKCVVRLTYHTFAEPEVKKHVIVHPYMLKEFNCRWYLIAGADDTSKILNFGLERIDAVDPRQDIEYREASELYDIYEDIVGVTYNPEMPVEKIFFWVSEKSKDYVLTKPIHESQRKVSAKDTMELTQKNQTLKDGLFLRIDCRVNYELIRELSSFGSDLIVVEPDSVRDKIMNRITKMAEAYSSLRK